MNTQTELCTEYGVKHQDSRGRLSIWAPAMLCDATDRRWQQEGPRLLANVVLLRRGQSRHLYTYVVTGDAAIHRLIMLLTNQLVDGVHQLGHVHP